MNRPARGRSPRRALPNIQKMKTIKKVAVEVTRLQSFPFLMLVLFIAAMLGLQALVAPAQLPSGPQYPQNFYAPTNLPATVAAATSSNQTSVFVLHVGKGFGFCLPFTGSTNASVTIQTSVNGTNYVPWLTLVSTNALNSVNSNQVASIQSNWPASTFVGIYSLNITTISNVGTLTLTNLGPVFNVPNL